MNGESVFAAIGIFSVGVIGLFFLLSATASLFEAYVQPWLVKNINKTLTRRINDLEQENFELRKQLEAK